MAECSDYTQTSTLWSLVLGMKQRRGGLPRRVKSSNRATGIRCELAARPAAWFRVLRKRMERCRR